jgi:transposase/phosphonate ABC transporter substrate-binding protein
VIVRRQLKRRYVLTFFQKLSPCLVGIEACGSAHHWSRELQALGHTVRLMPPAYVKPYVKRQKNDATDAEAICEAVTRANMRFVPTKTPEQQSGLVLHRARHLFIRQQTSVINAIRAHLAEFGIFPAQAHDKPTEIRVGTQKGGFLSAVRQRHTVEDTFKPLGVEIKWIDFQFGPPLLEAINVGSVDFGYVGDSPPIFAQAGSARIRCVATVKSEGNTQAIIVPQDSPIKTLVDLRGKRVAFGKGSSAHNLLIAAMEKVGPGAEAMENMRKPMMNDRLRLKTID